MRFKLSVGGAVGRHRKTLAFGLHHQALRRLGDFEWNVLDKSHEAESIDASGKVVVEAVVGTGVWETLHNAQYLTVGERAAKGDKGDVLA